MITQWQCSDCYSITPPSFEAAVDHVALAHSDRHPAVVEVLVVDRWSVKFRGRKLDQL